MTSRPHDPDPAPAPNQDANTPSSQRRTLIAAAGTALLAGCAQPGYFVDASPRSPAQNSRARYLIMHFTVSAPVDRALIALASEKAQVSAHYLVPESAAPDDELGRLRVHQLVSENRRAWHAGASGWRTDRELNHSSIGIEIVNRGHVPEDAKLPLMERRWYPFPEAQIDAVGDLSRRIVARHEIAPFRVLGHQDIAPNRKIDPGPLFPWERLYREFGVGAWPEADAVARRRTEHPYQGDVASLRRRLAAYGYILPEGEGLDPRLRGVVATFQMHFRPERYDGEPDVETVAILDALLEKYNALSPSTVL